jgi:hypothetical protein
MYAGLEGEEEDSGKLQVGGVVLNILFRDYYIQRYR